MPYKYYFDKIDAELLKISPRGDIMLLRVIAALIPVVMFGLDALYDLPVLFWLGIPFYLVCLGIYLEALLKTILFMHKVSAELLIVLVMAVTLVDGTPLSGAMVAWFIGLGLYISFTIIRKNREKIESLIQEGKKTAQVLKDGTIEEIPINRVRQHDVVLIPKGAMVPIDGIIIEGESSIDESTITGEPFPVYKTTGAEVTSGTLNLTGPLQVKADKNGDDSFLSVITQEIENSLLNKSALQKRADTTVQILLLSVTAYSFLLLFITGSLHLMATALAVVCPCAWALAMPTAFAANIGRLARSNILARGGEPLENMQDIKTLILDKTGTVTLAEPEVSQIIEIGLPRQRLLELAASIESRFDHPIARAIINFSKAQGITRLLPVEQAEDLPGRGIQALVDQQHILMGSAETLSYQDIELPAIEYAGRAIWLAVDREVKGVIVIRDIMLSEMQGLADTIHACGIEKVILATGDNEEQEAKRVADYINADEYYFNCTPEVKTELVKKYQTQGKVAMVGDGVNDAPALAAANVGIAIGGHKNVNLAIVSSDVVILGNDAQDLVTILRLSHKMGGIIRQNYLWAVSFNSIGLAMATFGLLNPILAALLHHVSSVFVVVNAGRLYFTGIEQSIIGPVFKKMDQMVNRAQHCQPEPLAAAPEIVAEPER
ncbi:MAG: cadmium-translocating P-type ATPase [Methylomonas sp.]|jgi:Cu+-exporting ATPase|uniref:heavy metal translocating P-type ATPase n=1 Tax=Methylomonas sp. TaxID=418 RepID=UPI0025E05385|nr:cation-translocating P-type ATPase [Methylomonas sp.]MCK9605768.1 cadmium-translocating P-type ATPase [Methylomonas sp.]